MALDLRTKEDLRSRFLQICRQYFRDDTFKEMSDKIGENDKVLNAICNGSRELGLSTIVRLCRSTPDIDINWLISGRGNMIVQNNIAACQADSENDRTIKTLRDMLREKDQKIADLTADIAILRTSVSHYLTPRGAQSSIQTVEETPTY